ncbi:MAG: aminopeptidase [Pseudohongiellaceae bacterium]
MTSSPTVSRATLLKLLVLLAVSSLLLSCEAVSYYAQAARGQMAIIFSRQDIQKLLDSGSLAASQEASFREVLAIREFATRELKLPVAEHYSTFVDLDREHVVWNVFAAPEFSTELRTWCYPIAGCVSYRGYFSEAEARRFADQLRDDGFDVYLGGVDAYSTLGWFEDSLLSTVMRRESHQLAGLIFHELAHQKVYVPGDTTFNESFATAVERAGVERWLLTSEQDEVLVQAELNRQRQAQFVNLVSDYREQFSDLYQQDLSTSDMREQKAALQERMRADYRLMRRQWDGYRGYDSWFDRSLNNAQLATVSSYNDLVPAFTALLTEAGGDFAAFYGRVAEIAELDKVERDALLATYGS